MSYIHIAFGGPIHRISVGGRLLTFEMHPHIGPVALKRNGDPAKRQPGNFLQAASQWAQQGQRTENGICVWDEKIPLK